MKPFVIAAFVKLGKSFAVDPIGTASTIVTATVIAAPYVLGVGAVAGVGYGIYKLVKGK